MNIIGDLTLVVGLWIIIGFFVTLGFVNIAIKDYIYDKIRERKVHDKYNEWFEAHEERYHSDK